MIIAAVVGLTVFANHAAFAATTARPTIVLADESTAYSVIGHAAVLDDPTGNLDIDDIAQSTAFVAGDRAPEPPDGGVRWYRFAPTLPARAAGRWFLTTARQCSEADLYLPRRQGGYSFHPFGYRVPFARHPAPGIAPAVLTDDLDGRTVFVRLMCERGPQRLAFRSEDAIANNPMLAIVDGLAIGVVFLGILAGGLAIVTRSAAYALAGLTGVSALAAAPHHFAQWFPTVALPPYWLLGDIGQGVFTFCQWRFYDTFFELRARDARGRRLLLAATWCVIAGQFLFDGLAPQRWAYTPAFYFAEGLTNVFFYLTVAFIAIESARKGNRSAWFVAAGTGVYLAGLGGAFAASIFAPPLLLPSAALPIPIDLMLFIVGVGDRLRQVSLAHERALEERDAAQATLVARQRDHITDIERRNTSFARFVPAEFLRQLDRAEIVDVQLGDHVERDMAVLFSDIRGFTSLAERLSPAETFDFLNAYLARAGPLIRAHAGFIDKYVGDAIVALFPQRPSDALDAAIALQSEVRRFNEDRARRGFEPLAIGVGVNYGRMMLGTIGERERYETTVIADSVNVASRLEGLTKVYGVSIITSASCVEALADRDAYCLRILGDVSLRGHRRAEGAYELFDGDPHELVLHKRRTLDDFEAALEAYRTGQYARSRERFAEIAAANPLDRAAAYLRDRSLVMGDATVTSTDA
jgi:class 3 adenylate cyclase